MDTIDLIVLGILKKESLSAYDMQKLVEYLLEIAAQTAILSNLTCCLPLYNTPIKIKRRQTL